MFRWIPVFILIASSYASADPIPKESDESKIKRLWGELVDSGGGTKIKLDGEKLRMTIPPGDRLVYPMRGGTPTFVPYVMKTVNGDFEAMVTVHRHLAPADSHVDPSNPLTGSGLVLIFDTQSITSLCQATMRNRDTPQIRSTFRYQNGSSTTTGGNSNQNKSNTCTLRIRRKSEVVEYEYSFDEGKKWQRFTTMNRGKSGEVKIGIYAEHSCDATTEAVFEKFVIKPLSDEKKP